MIEPLVKKLWQLDEISTIDDAARMYIYDPVAGSRNIVGSTVKELFGTSKNITHSIDLSNYGLGIVCNESADLVNVNFQVGVPEWKFWSTNNTQITIPVSVIRSPLLVTDPVVTPGANQPFCAYWDGTQVYWWCSDVPKADLERPPYFVGTNKERILLVNNGIHPNLQLGLIVLAMEQFPNEYKVSETVEVIGLNNLQYPLLIAQYGYPGQPDNYMRRNQYRELGKLCPAVLNVYGSTLYNNKNFVFKKFTAQHTDVDLNFYNAKWSLTEPSELVRSADTDGWGNDPELNLKGIALKRYTLNEAQYLDLISELGHVIDDGLASPSYVSGASSFYNELSQTTVPYMNQTVQVFRVNRETYDNRIILLNDFAIGSRIRFVDVSGSQIIVELPFNHTIANFQAKTMLVGDLSILASLPGYNKYDFYGDHRSFFVTQGSWLGDTVEFQYAGNGIWRVSVFDFAGWADGQVSISKLNQSGATDGQVIAWNNALKTYAPANPSLGPVLEVAQAIGIGGTPTDYPGYNSMTIRGEGTINGGVIELTTSNDSTRALLYTQGGSFHIVTISNHPIVFDTNSSEKMRITEGGNLLIGSTVETAAAERLQVAGNAYVGGTILTDGFTTKDDTGVYGITIGRYSPAYSHSYMCPSASSNGISITDGPATKNILTTVDTGKVLINCGGSIVETAGGETLQVTGTGYFSSTLAVESNIVLPKTSGVGMKVDIAAPTFGWRDLEGVEMVDSVGANRPTLNTYRGAIRENSYSVNDIMDIRFHIPHDYLPGSDLYLHVHWSHNGTVISGNYTGTFNYSYAKGHNQAAFHAPKTVSVTYATTNVATTPQYRHRIEEVIFTTATAGGTATLLDKAIIEPDGLVLVNFSQTAIPTITGGTIAEPFVHRIDIHYQSTNMPTKQKAPDFYV